MKVVTIVGTRPEIIRLSRVMTMLDTHTQHIIVHTGQNYDFELNEIFFKDLEIRDPDFFLGANGKTAAETIGLVISQSDRVLKEIQPDAVLILGDTNSCLSAISAKRQKIPIFHMEAGNRCFDQRVPEEINRRIVDHISDINLPYSDIAREYLLREGISPDRVIKTGSPMYEVISHYRNRIDSSTILDRMNLIEQEYFVVSAHREENIENIRNFTALINALNSIANQYMMPIIVSTHPRTRKRIDESGISLHSNIRLSKPLCFTDYVHLQIRARATLSDSGTITEESSILGFPALNIRETHERPEGMEEAAVMMTGLSTQRILDCLNILESDLDNRLKQRISPVRDYIVPNVSEKILRIILSYTDYVRQNVWRL
jgi:UDP-N-acetylglucosamine 2-epimerase (non-hydrolysing)